MRAILIVPDRDTRRGLDENSDRSDLELRILAPEQVDHDPVPFAGAEAVLFEALAAPVEMAMLGRVREIAPDAVRIVVRPAAGGGWSAALRQGAEEAILAEVLDVPGLRAAEIRRAVAAAQARRDGARSAAGPGEEADLFRVIFENDFVAVSLNALEGPYVAVNAAWVRETGFRREEAIGRTPLELGLWKDAGQLRRVMRDLRGKGRTVIDEMRLGTKGGGEKICRVGLGLVDLRGKPHCVCFARDVTEERRLAREFLHAQKMDAVGRLAAGVAHDFNNLLTVIQMATYFARRADGDALSLQECLEEIDQSGRRGATLVRQLLSFARRDAAEPAPVCLDEVVSDLLKLIRRVIGEEIELESPLGGGQARVFVDPGQVEQILMNLALNARDAMPRGGRLTLETAVENGGSSTAETGGGGEVRLTVRDTGCGMSEDVRSRLFEPFFTTKPVGEGTGLGLVSVQHILSRTGGRVVVESEPGRGSAFHVFFPRHTGAVDAVAPAPPVEVRGGRERILLVEDDPALRRRLRDALAAYGYTVTPAPDGETALREAAGRRFDLVISDVRMPGMSGPEAVRRLRGRHGRVPAIYLSGYGERPLRDAEGAPARAPVLLQKPFTSEALLRAVRDVLDRRAGSKLTSPGPTRRDDEDGCGAGGDPPRDRAPRARGRDRRDAPDSSGVR